MKPISLAVLAAFALTVVGCSAPTVKHDDAEKASTAKEAQFDPDPTLIQSHMAYLASDELEGREAGTEGYDKAAAYVAEKFAELGLSPAGDNGTYFQEIQFKRGYRVAETSGLTASTSDGTDLGFEKHVDYAIGASVRSEASQIEAPIVFAGYGIVAPEVGRDDFDGLDVDGNIVALLARTPSGFDTEERAYYGSLKNKNASDRGAVGVIQLETRVSNQVYAFQRLVSEGRLDAAQMSWVAPDGDPYSNAPGLQAGATLSIAGATRLFAAAGVDYADILDAAEEEGGVMPGMELPVTMLIEQNATIDEVLSSNVVAMIEGSDPQLKEEVIVLTGHLDHIGVSKTFEEDRINNGAIDNAAGIATLLETARMIMEGEAPRRSILLLAVTAEEKGLLGSQYYAKNPTIDASKIVGNVNLDMPVLTYAFEDLIVFGGTRSTINAAIEKAAGEMGLVVSPDPMAEQGIFTRSDHYRFVQEGVPSVMLATGFANGGEAAWATHFATTYHRPSDDMSNSLDFDAAARFAELKTRIALTLANADERPLWNKDDFFARQFNGPMQE